MNITQNIALDLTKRSVFQYVSAKQGDNSSRLVEITLTNNGEIYQVPKGVGANFRAQKPDGTMILNQASVNGDGTVTVELTQQTLAVCGDVIADIYLTNGSGSVLSSASFVIHVEAAPMGDRIDSENEFLTLIRLAERAEHAASTVEDKVSASEIGLGIGSDGKIYVTVLGTPVGEGVSVNNISKPEPPVQIYGSPVTDKQALRIPSGGKASVGVKLSTRPNLTQVVTVITGSPLISANKTDLSFGPADWDKYQYVEITAGVTEMDESANITLRNSDPLLTESFVPVTILADGYSVDTTIPADGRHTITRADFAKTQDYGAYVRLYGYKGQYKNIVIPSKMEDGKIPSIMTDGPAFPQNQAFPPDCGIEYVTFEDGVVIGGPGAPTSFDASSLFKKVASLIGVSNLPTQISGFRGTFSECKALRFIDNLEDLVNVTDASEAFSLSGIEYIQDLSGWNKVTELRSFAKEATNLILVYGLPVSSSVYKCNQSFTGCTALQSIEIPESADFLFHTFKGCSALRKCKIYSERITNVDNAFTGCSDLHIYAVEGSQTYNSLISAWGINPGVTISGIGGSTFPNLVIWGDSTSSPDRTWKEWPARLIEKVPNMILKNQAVSGEMTCSTAARQGGNQLLVGAVTIPAETTPVPITLSTEKDGQTFGKAGPTFSAGAGFNPCYIGKIPGNISSQSGDYAFTRSSAGNEVVVPDGSKVTSKADEVFNNSNTIMLVNLGVNSGWNSNPNLLLKQVQSMVDHFKAKGGTKYIITGLYSGYMMRTAENRAISLEYEKLASAAFTDHWLNLREYLIENGMEENGLEPTPTDTQRMALGQIPGSLLGAGGTENPPKFPDNSQDDTHPNAYGQNSIANAFYSKGQQLGYWT